MVNFVVIVGNEVAVNFHIPTEGNETNPMYGYFEKLVAALSSNPNIVVTQEKIEEGSIWDGNSFTSPVE